MPSPFYRQRRIRFGQQLAATRRAGPCAVIGCTRPLIGLGKFCRTHRKHQALTGSATHPPIDKDESFKGTLRTLAPLIDWKAPAMLDMLREMKTLLTALPRAPRQGSTRGLKPRALAQAILWHIVAQRKYVPAKQVLLTALAAECTPKLCSSMQYRQAQVARCIYNRLLHGEKRELFGRSILVRISMQGKWAKQRMFEVVEPVYRWELEKIRGLLYVERRLKAG